MTDQSNRNSSIKNSGSKLKQFFDLSKIEFHLVYGATE